MLLPAQREGLQLCARFSLPTTERRYCGPVAATAALRGLLTTGGGYEEARLSLRDFEALYPYLEMLAEETGRDPFDVEVVEAYWLGNDLLERDWREPYRRLLRHLMDNGLPPTFAERLAANIPADAIWQHTFHVLFVGVGAVTGAVPTTLPNMDACRISWGTVEEVAEDGLVVEGPTLAWVDEAYVLDENRRRKVAWDPSLLPDVQRGDAVALHWETAVERLEKRRLANLIRFTERAIRAANEAGRRSAKDLGVSERGAS